MTPLTALLTCRAPIVQNSLGWISASSRLPAARFDMLCMLARGDAHGALRTGSAAQGSVSPYRVDGFRPDLGPGLSGRNPLNCDNNM